MNQEKENIDLVKIQQRSPQTSAFAVLIKEALEHNQAIRALKRNPCLVQGRDGTCGGSHRTISLLLMVACPFLMMGSIVMLVTHQNTLFASVCLVASIICGSLIPKMTRIEKRFDHKVAYAINMAELEQNCVPKYLAAKVAESSHDLLKPDGDFNQLNELFATQIKVFGAPLLKQTQEEALPSRPYLVAYSCENQAAEITSLPPEFDRLHKRLEYYFADKVRELEILCHEYLPKIAEMQDRAESADAPKAVKDLTRMGARHLEGVFISKQAIILEQIREESVRHKEALRRLFRGGSQEELIYDIINGREIAHKLANTLPSPAPIPLLPLRIAISENEVDAEKASAEPEASQLAGHS